MTKQRVWAVLVCSKIFVGLVGIVYFGALSGATAAYTASWVWYMAWVIVGAVTIGDCED